MASDWMYLQLKDVIDLVADNRGRNPESYSNEGIPVIDNYLIISEGYVNLNEVKRCVDERTYESFIRKHIQENDVLITLVGNGYGQVALTPSEKCVIIQNTIGLRCNSDNDNIFLYYLLKNNRKALMNLNIGAAQPSIKVGNLTSLEFQFPPLSEQKAIAHILGSLDDKIELNRQMNETLEAMAQALFKSWFVDFDPVIDNALAAGNAIPDEFSERAEQRKAIEKKEYSEIQKLFPDEFEFTEEMGWIPKGWSVQSFGDLLDSTIGGDWGKLEEDEKHTKESVIIRGTDIPKLKIGERSEAPNRWVEEKKLKTRILRPFDIVIEISGGSPTQSTGRSIIITEQILERLGGVAEPASFCRKFSPSNKFLGLYAGIHLQKIYDDGKMWEYQNQSTGIANFQTTSFLEREQLVVPNESVLLKFYETLDPVISKMNSNQQIELAKLRDTLLPKLMSGELRISDAAELVDEAV